MTVFLQQQSNSLNKESVLLFQKPCPMGSILDPVACICYIICHRPNKENFYACRDSIINSR